MDIGPVIVERDAARIGMTGGFQAKPVLDLAFLPVDRGQLRRERWEARLVRGNGRLEVQIAGLAWLFEDVVVVEDAIGGNAIFGKHRHQSGVIRRAQVTGEGTHVRPEESDGDLALGCRWRRRTY